MTQEYIFEDSLVRIDKTISAPVPDHIDVSLPGLNEIDPSRIYRVNAAVMFVNFHLDFNSIFPLNVENNSTLLSFVSEAIKIGRSNPKCRDITVGHNIIMFVYDTPFKADLETMLDDSAKIRTLAMIVSQKMHTKGYCKLITNIGIDYGATTMLPVEITPSLCQFIWNGPTVSKAKDFSEKGHDYINITHTVWQNLDEKRQEMFVKVEQNLYQGQIINIMMNNWLTK